MLQVVRVAEEATASLETSLLVRVSSVNRNAAELEN